MRKVRCEITGGRKEKKGMRKEDGKMRCENSRGRKDRKKEGKIRCKIILDT